MPDTPRVWFITGCATGFGAVTAQAALDRGDRVVATDKDGSTLGHLVAREAGQLLALPLDVTDGAGIDHAVDNAIKHYGQIDLLVNNAGLGLGGPFEEIPTTEIRRLFEVNILGLMGVTQAILPHMRQQGHGRIINLSSDSGIIGLPFQSVYCATKHAVEGFAESLSHEVAPFGIQVTNIEPCGFFRTAMPTNAVAEATRRHGPDSPYYTRVAMQVAYAQTGLEQASDPRLVAEAILALADMPQPPLRYPVGNPDRIGLLAMRRQMPDEEFVQMIRANT